jgi:hypothetical protein
MPRVVYFKPLDGFGKSPVDLDACPRVWTLEPQGESEEERPEYDFYVGTFRIYLSPQNRWIQHRQFYDLDNRGNVCNEYNEISLLYVIQNLHELGFSGEKLPADLSTILDPYKELLEELQKGDPWVLYGPRCTIEPASPPEATGPPEAPAEKPLVKEPTKRPRDRGLRDRVVGVGSSGRAGARPLDGSRDRWCPRGIRRSAAGRPTDGFPHRRPA